MPDVTDEIILTARDLKTYFPVRSGLLGRSRDFVRAVDGVDFDIPRGRTLGLVGESGSGKTTVGRTILRLVPAMEGSAVFDGVDVLSADASTVRRLRKRMQMIFQDPFGSLNPRMTVGAIIAEPLRVHASLTREERRRRVGSLLERVGLSKSHVNRYPHEFSGGQRQRIGIARALAPAPDFIVCDEPVSALDVSIQAQILNLLNDLQEDLGLSYLFIAHNLAVVEHFADEVAVMYLGRIVESASKQVMLGGGDGRRTVRHPYTEALLASVPEPDPAARRGHVALPGEVPSPIHPPSGCAFHPRCPLTRSAAAAHDAETVTILAGGEQVKVMRRCVVEEPKLAPANGDGSHRHACLLRQGATFATTSQGTNE